MVQISDRDGVLTADDELFLQTVADDTEEAPWMVMGDPQLQSATGLYWSLRIYARTRHLPWYVGGMLPILYPRPRMGRKGQIAPDVMVAFVADRVRHSYDLEVEGVPPAFTLEVISPSSILQDTVTKRRTYRILGVQEYVLFAPEPELRLPALQGYRRSADGRFLRMRPDARGRLWSRELGLYVVAEGMSVVAWQPDGTPLLTPEQEAEARQAEMIARLEAETQYARAEAEVTRLRAEVERLRRER